MPPGPDVTNDRWLVAWQPHLANKSAPQRIGGPDFSGAGGSTITAAHRIVAATFVIGTALPGGAAGGPPAPAPIPASLQALVKDGTISCSIQAPCLFFETSTDRPALDAPSHPCCRRLLRTTRQCRGRPRKARSLCHCRAQSNPHEFSRARNQRFRGACPAQ